jgi:hypothetical protein
MNITDNYEFYKGWVEVYDPDNNFLGNFSLNYHPISKRYYWNQTYTKIGNYSFIIYTNDTSNNWASTLDSFKIVDTTPPLILDITSIPDPQEVYFLINISANINNYELFGAWIEIYDPQLNFVGNFSMKPDLINGRFYFERSFNSLDDYTFTIWSNDTSDNWNFASNSFIIHDTTSPIIININADPNPQEVFQNVNISATILDNYQLNGTWIRIEDPEGSLIGNISMNYDPVTDKYFVNRNYYTLGIYSYTIFATDTENNWISQSGSFTIHDTIPPDIVNVSSVPDPQEVFGAINIQAQVTDNYQLSNVWIEIFYPNGTLLKDVQLDYNLSNNIYFTNDLFNRIGTFSFTIWANDSSDNIASVSGSLIVHDTTSPVISDSLADPNPQEVFGEVEINAWVTDNYQLDGVWVEIFKPDNTLLGNYTMVVNQSLLYHYQKSAYGLLGNYNYTIWTKDISNNWATDSGMFSIVDTTPPVITNIIFPSTKKESEVLKISANVTDNYQLSMVWIEVFDTERDSVEIIEIEYDPILKKYYFNKSFNNSGTYTFTIRAIDSSDNPASFSDSFIIEPVSEPDRNPDEYNWKPLMAIIFAISLLILGLVAAYFRPVKFSGTLLKDRVSTFLLGVLPFVVLEIITGIISYFTGLLSIPPVLGIGMIIDLSILIVGIICCMVIFLKGVPKELYEEEFLEAENEQEPPQKQEYMDNADSDSSLETHNAQESGQKLVKKEHENPSAPSEAPPPPPPPSTP